jgi:uncharacterized cupredoxin-like copper-binding protein
MKRQLFIFIVGAMLLSACASAPAAAAPTLAATNTPAPEKVTVTLSEFAFESSLTTFKAGETYEFVITNKGVINHELAITHPMDEMDMHGDGTAMHHEGALLVVTQEQLPPNTTVTVTVTFPKTEEGENFEIACHVPGHYDAGMHLPITVNQ